MSDAKKRIFLAIDLPKNIIAGLKKYSGRSLPVRWTKPENLHVTMKFLGDVDEPGLERVLQVVEKICGRHGPVALELDSVRPFRYMIWATLKRNPRLEELYRDLEQALSGEGLGQEQHPVFRPHICLARARNGDELETERRDCSFKFTATHVVVFESVLKSGGPIYVSLDAFELMQNAKLN